MPAGLPPAPRSLLHCQIQSLEAEMPDKRHVMVPVGQEEKKAVTEAGSCKGSGGEGGNVFTGNRKVRLPPVPFRG